MIWGYHHFRKPPYIYHLYPIVSSDFFGFRLHVRRKKNTFQPHSRHQLRRVFSVHQKDPQMIWTQTTTPHESPIGIQSPCIIGSGQIIIFHQPSFPWNKKVSLTKPPFGVRSCEVAIIWPDWMIGVSFITSEKHSYLGSMKPFSVSVSQTNRFFWVARGGQQKSRQQLRHKKNIKKQPLQGRPLRSLQSLVLKL